MLEKVLKYSVNTWSEGFLDKLYGSTNAVGFYLRGRREWCESADNGWMK